VRCHSAHVRGRGAPPPPRRRTAHRRVRQPTQPAIARACPSTPRYRRVDGRSAQAQSLHGKRRRVDCPPPSRREN
jgi:hypothetical protein